MYYEPAMRYRAARGGGAFSDWADHAPALTADELQSCRRCALLRLDPNEDPDLAGALSRAAEELRETEEALCPSEEGYTVDVVFVNPAETENLNEVSAAETFYSLFEDANGDYADIRDFIERCAPEYFGPGELPDLAERVADEMGITDFSL